MTKIIEINSFSDDNLFENLTINVEKNTITTISGSNSCGKTTLMRISNKLSSLKLFISIILVITVPP